MRSKLTNNPVRTPLRAALLAGATAFALIAASGAARASLINKGVTYTLTESATANVLVDQFTLGISGINGTSDTEGGRSDVNAIAFGQPSNYSTAKLTAVPSLDSPLANWSVQDVGLNSSGCSNGGGYFCFSNGNTLSSTALPSDSTLSYTFTVTLTSGDFSTYAPTFKIDWVGNKNNYNLVSQSLLPKHGNGSFVPEPGSLALLGTGLIGLGLAMRRRRRS